MGRDEQEQQHDEKVDQLLDEYAQRRIDRLEFFKRAGVLGIGVAAAGALLAACGGDDTAAPAPEEPAAPPPAPEPEPPPPAPEPEPPPRTGARAAATGAGACPSAARRAGDA